MVFWTLYFIAFLVAVNSKAVDVGFCLISRLMEWLWEGTIIPTPELASDEDLSVPTCVVKPHVLLITHKVRCFRTRDGVDAFLDTSLMCSATCGAKKVYGSISSSEGGTKSSRILLRLVGTLKELDFGLLNATWPSGVWGVFSGILNVVARSLVPCLLRLGACVAPQSVRMSKLIGVTPDTFELLAPLCFGELEDL